MIGLPGFFATYHGRVSAEIARLVNGTDPVERAMAYTASAPSKQVRAVLTIVCAELCGGSAARAMPAAAAIELVHAASLILDDLPSMDDAPLRRGLPVESSGVRRIHRDSGGVRPLNLAYGTFARAYEPDLAARLATLTSDAVGPDGLIGGQALDLLATDQQISFEMLERIHRGKTGALFVAAASCRRRSLPAPAAEADRCARGLRQEPRPRVSDRRRPARRRRRSGADGKGGP